MQSQRSEHGGCHPGEHLPNEKGHDSGFQRAKYSGEIPHGYNHELCLPNGHIQGLEPLAVSSMTQATMNRLTVKGREAIHIFLFQLLMDSTAHATGLECRSAYRARQACILFPFHHIRRFLTTEAQTCASGIATSVLRDKGLLAQISITAL